MNVIISETICGNPNCIGVEAYGTKPPNPNIIIEDKWTVPQKLIEESMVGLVSHETIEYLLANILFDYPEWWNLHDLIGSGQTFEEYSQNTDGLCFRNKKRRKTT